MLEGSIIRDQSTHSNGGFEIGFVTDDKEQNLSVVFDTLQTKVSYVEGHHTQWSKVILLLLFSH